MRTLIRSLAGPHLGEKLLQGRAVKGGTGKGAVIIAFVDRAPAFVRLALDIGLTSLAASALCARPLARSHSLSFSSTLPDKAVFPSGAMATELIALVCPNCGTNSTGYLSCAGSPAEHAAITLRNPAAKITRTNRKPNIAVPPNRTRAQLIPRVRPGFERRLARELPA